MLLSDPASNQRRRICIVVGLVLSSLATYYGLKDCSFGSDAALRSCRSLNPGCNGGDYVKKSLGSYRRGRREFF